MFDLFSWNHLIIMLAVALIVVGPKDIPKLMNMAGKWLRQARGMANELRKSFDELAQQSELDALRREIEELRSNQIHDPIQAELNISDPISRPPPHADQSDIVNSASAPTNAEFEPIRQ